MGQRKMISASQVRMPITIRDVAAAYERIRDQIHATDIVTSESLNRELGHHITFKLECNQRVRAFKARGALNALKKLQGLGQLPNRVVAYSSGNHAQGVAWAARELGIPATIFIPANASKVKIQATRDLGAQVVVCRNRAEAEMAAAEIEANGAYLIPPFDHDSVIEGQGTVLYEALQQGARPGVVFVPCGGGGLASGTQVVASSASPRIRTFAAEPLAVNDAAESIRQGRIVEAPHLGETIADGVRTPRISERTFQYLRQLDGFVEVNEDAIIFWTQKLNSLLRPHLQQGVIIEPTAALAMAAANQWLARQEEGQNVLVILTGGNVDEATAARIWPKSKL